MKEIRLSFREVKSYIGQSVNVPMTTFPSNPDAPYNSQESQSYMGNSDTFNVNPFCPACKSINLLFNKKDNSAKCGDCGGRFSTKNFSEGNMFSQREIPRATGLFNSDEGSNSAPDVHSTNEIGGGSWSVALGK